jgi:hypothetical protein
MSQSPAFEFVCARIETAAGWNRLVARGTVRLALRDMGLDPRTVSKKEMIAALRTTLPKALEFHRIANPPAICLRIENELAMAVLDEKSIESPEEIFKRLGRP